ncbi:MAG: hypothetical protein ACRC20_16080 [Segniliparus sp.]|uniref:hypothetical protein n=1 Tax=Segniliparus sp. TaxID=2804064 RepID=UPI003F2FF21C
MSSSNDIPDAAAEARSAKIQLRCLYAALGIGVLVLGTGLMALAPWDGEVFWGVLPPRTGMSGSEIARVYIEHRTRIQVAAAVVALIAIPYLILCTVVVPRIRKMEKGFPIFTTMWTVSIAITAVTLMLISMFFAIAAYRPNEVDPNTTRLFNDLAWLGIIYTAPFFNVWAAAPGIATLLCERGKETLPRWSAYVSLLTAAWSPAILTAVFLHGPFAYDSLFGTWLPLLIFASFMAVIFGSTGIGLAKEIREHRAAEEARELDHARPPAHAALATAGR